MKPRIARLLLLAAIACSAPLARATDAVTANVGGVSIVIPSTPETLPLRNAQSPAWKMQDDYQVSVHNTLLAYFFPPDAAKAADAGKLVEVSPQWGVVLVSNAARERDISAKDFERVKQNAEKRINDALTTQKSLDRINRKVQGSLDKAESARQAELTVKLGDTTPLGVYGTGERHLSLGYAMKMKSSTKDGKEAVTSTVMITTQLHLRKRLVVAILYRDLHDRSDIEKAKAAARAWTTAILAANR